MIHAAAEPDGASSGGGDIQSEACALFRSDIVLHLRLPYQSEAGTGGEEFHYAPDGGNKLRRKKIFRNCQITLVGNSCLPDALKFTAFAQNLQLFGDRAAEFVVFPVG